MFSGMKIVQPIMGLSRAGPLAYIYLTFIGLSLLILLLYFKFFFLITDHYMHTNASSVGDKISGTGLE